MLIFNTVVCLELPSTSGHSRCETTPTTC